ncbi:MAG: 3-isopropylmalate dehydrogenase [Bdellovibrionales bacterium]|nr:3-isopropylmalate dehydrogenase [Bdellovibrionales bacterium]
MKETTKRIAILSGDGIGPEVIQQSIRVLDAIASKYSYSFEYLEALIGGAAFRESGEHLPATTLEIAKQADAILFGSVGGPLADAEKPEWKNCERNCLLGIRKAFSFHANLRPARVYPALKAHCPLKESVIEGGVDILIVRELLGDIYFGLHETIEQNQERFARDVAEYSESQIRAIAHNAFQAAMARSKQLTSVDKANVLDTSRLWRTVMNEVAEEYPQVRLQHMLVDNCAMQLIQNPRQFDVIVTANLFGDILSDAAAVLPGSLGLTPSASLSSSGFGMYEPSGGSAPDIAGKNIANPVAQILSAALMLRYSFRMQQAAEDIEKAVARALDRGARTKDISLPGDTVLNTTEMTDVIVSCLAT